MPTAIGIILARGGSKGIPNKNLTEINGKPLIYYTLTSALQSKLDKVYVSTDDIDIADYCSQLGASIITRPDNISGDRSPSEDALLHSVKIIDRSELVVFLQCTSPLIHSSHINQGLREFEDQNLDSLFSAVKSNDTFIWSQIGGELRSLTYDWQNRSRRQDCDHNILETGSFYIFKKQILLQNKNRLGGKIGFTLLPERTKHEVDSPEDLAVVSALLSENYYKSND